VCSFGTSHECFYRYLLDNGIKAETFWRKKLNYLFVSFVVFATLCIELVDTEYLDAGMQ